MNKQEFEEVKTKFAKETRSKKISKWLNIGSMSFAVLGIAMASSFLIDDVINKPKDNLIIDKETNLEILRLKSELSKTNEINIKLLKEKENDSLDKFTNNEFKKLQQDLENLNQVILDNPEKAISIPILKVEIENQKAQNEKELNSIKNDIARVYDMNKWIIGLVFTMLVSIVVLNISNLFAKNNKKE
jgi:hypothetical protein